MKARLGIVAVCAVLAAGVLGLWMIRGGVAGTEVADTNALVTQSAASTDVPTLPKPAEKTADPVPLEDVLGRPIVFYAEGTLGAGFFDILRALDADTRAFDYAAQPKALTDVDVYLLKAPDWNRLRARTDHVLHANIVANLDGQPDTTGFSWFQVRLSAKDGSSARDVLVILANDAGLKSLSQFCTVVSIYDLLRFAHDGGALTGKTGTQALRTDACRTAGWRSAADIPQSN